MADESVRVVGRYALHGEIAAGGMASVHFGRLLGPVGFSKTVAIKQLHPQFAKDPEFVSMFLDEARVAARIQHPNVVSTIDIVPLENELFLVMEYVEGESLARLIRAARSAGQRIPPRIVSTVMIGALYGLHAAHETKTEAGRPMDIIHRDVSPQNILVGIDGVPRVFDFGVAKAVGRSQRTQEGQLKGKLAYMAPEQVLGDELDRRGDVYSAGVVLWEALVGKRLFDGENEGNILRKVVSATITPPSALVPNLPFGADNVVMRALSRDPGQRYATAWDFAVALEEVFGVETQRALGAFVQSCASDSIERRSARVRQLESISTEADGAALLLAQSGSSPEASSSPSRRDDATRVSPERASARAVLAILAILGAGALAALAIILLKMGSESKAAQASVSSIRSAPSADPTTSSRSVTTSPTVDATVSVAAPSLEVSSTPVASTPGVRTVAGTGRRSATAVTTPPPPPPPPNEACKNPYYYEAGIKKIKPGCLR